MPPEVEKLLRQRNQESPGEWARQHETLLPGGTDRFAASRARLKFEMVKNKLERAMEARPAVPNPSVLRDRRLAPRLQATAKQLERQMTVDTLERLIAERLARPADDPALHRVLEPASTAATAAVGASSPRRRAHERAATQNRVEQLLLRRPEPQQLQQTGVLLGHPVALAPSLHPARRQLERSLATSHLFHALNARRSKEDLEAQGVYISVDTGADSEGNWVASNEADTADGTAAEDTAAEGTAAAAAAGPQADRQYSETYAYAEAQPQAQTQAQAHAQAQVQAYAQSQHAQHAATADAEVQLQAQVQPAAGGVPGLTTQELVMQRLQEQDEAQQQLQLQLQFQLQHHQQLLLQRGATEQEQVFAHLELVAQQQQLLLQQQEERQRVLRRELLEIQARHQQELQQQQQLFLQQQQALLHQYQHQLQLQQQAQMQAQAQAQAQPQAQPAQQGQAAPAPTPAAPGAAAAATVPTQALPGIEPPSYQRRSKAFHLTRTLLKVVAQMSEAGEISLPQKGVLKDLIVDQDRALLAVAEQYDRENNLVEFKDALVRVAMRK
jgi:hypothetical protein